jgi:hypothetical protein
MRPQTYHDAERNRLGAFLKSCRECLHGRQIRGVPVCLKYRAQVRLSRTSDDWDGRPKIGHNPGVGLHGGIYYHDDIPGFDSYLRLALHYTDEPYTVVCLNYDVILEYALTAVGRGFSYGPPTPPGSVPIAKIHGSINWLNPAGRAIAFGNVPGGWKDIFSRVAPVIYTNRFNVEQPMILDPGILRRLRLKDLFRSGADYFEPILLPPLGDRKDYEKVNLYNQVWAFADKMLGDATDLVIIGSALREYDTRLSQAIARNLKKDTRIIPVGNKDRIMEGLRSKVEWQIDVPSESYPDFFQSARTL